MGEIASLIMAVATFIAVVGNLAIAFINSNKIEAIHVATNSMKDALVKTTGDAARAEGKEEGRIEGEVKAAALLEKQK